MDFPFAISDRQNQVGREDSSQVQMRLSSLLIAAMMMTSAPAVWGQESSDDLVARLVQESQKHAIPRNLSPTDPLFQAESYAAGLAADVSEFNVWMIEIIKAYANRGDFNSAAYLAKRLPGSGNGLAHAEIAALLAASPGRQSEAESYLKVARKELNQVSGLPAELMRARCALALYYLGRESEAMSLEAELGKLELLSLNTRLHEANLLPAISLLDAKRLLVTLTEQGNDERQARFLLACAQQHFKKGSPELAKPFLEEIGTMAMERGLPTAQRVLLDLARTAHAGGQALLANKSMNLFLKCCEGYSDNAEWKAPFLAAAAEILIEWKRLDEARAWLKAAEATIPKIFVMDAPAAMLAIARQRAKLDGPDSAEPLLLASARAGRSHSHPRFLAETAVRICLHAEAVSTPVSAEVTGILNPADVEVKP